MLACEGRKVRTLGLAFREARVAGNPRPRRSGVCAREVRAVMSGPKGPGLPIGEMSVERRK